MQCRSYRRQTTQNSPRGTKAAQTQSYANAARALRPGKCKRPISQQPPTRHPQAYCFLLCFLPKERRREALLLLAALLLVEGGHLGVALGLPRGLLGLLVLLLGLSQNILAYLDAKQLRNGGSAGLEEDDDSPASGRPRRPSAPG